MFAVLAASLTTAQLLSWGWRVAFLLSAVLVAFGLWTQAAFITEQFSPRLRSTGSSLAYTLAGVLGGALAPLLLTSLQADLGWAAAAGYVALACVLSAVGLALGRDHDPREEAELAATPSTPAAPDRP